jgi:hypothetical protein
VVEQAMLSTVTRLPGGRDTVIRNDTSSSPLGSVRVVLGAAKRPRRVTVLSSASTTGVFLASIASNDGHFRRQARPVSPGLWITLVAVDAWPQKRQSPAIGARRH